MPPVLTPRKLLPARLLALLPTLLLVALGAGPLTARAANEPAASVPAERRALVIGNSSYEVFTRLQNPRNDATEMCGNLGRLGFQASCHQDLRDRADFLARVKAFAAQLKADTQTVFFYAGHAVQVGGENYLVPTGAGSGIRERDAAALMGQFVAMNDIYNALGASVGRFQLVVLDACRNDPFAKDERPTAVASRSILHRTLDTLKGDYGLGSVKDAPAGTIVLYATAAKDTAFDGNDGHGPLTKHLLAHIGTPEITVEEMIKRVTAAVQDETLKGFGKRQTPFVYSSFTGSFCFAGCPRVVDPNELKRMAAEKADLDRQLKEQVRRADEAARKRSTSPPAVIVTPTF